MINVNIEKLNITTYVKKFPHNEKAFSLVEMLVVISIVSLVAIIPLVALQPSRDEFSLESGHSIVLQTLEKARNDAMAGVANLKHGVHIEQTAMTIFSGDTYTGIGTVIPLPPNVQTDQSGTDIIFDRVTGDTTSDFTVTVSHTSGNTRSINVTSHGNLE